MGVHTFPMDDDLNPYNSRSVVGTAQLALWIFFCVLLNRIFSELIG
jgi:hypothetical protein